MQLPQSGNIVPAIIVVLQPKETGIRTGFMGGCCSVVLCSGKVIGSEDYRLLFGQHGSGGPAAIAWGKLLADFENVASSKIVVIAAPEDFRKFEYKKKVLKDLGKITYMFNGDIVWIELSDAFVSRSGVARAYNENEFPQPVNYRKL